MKLKLSISFLSFILFSSVLFSQIPSAEVFSNDTAFCESGDAIFKVRFTGAAPFAFMYQIGSTIYIEDGGGTIFGDTYEKTLSLNSSASIVLVKVYDSNDQLNTSDPMGSGSDNVTGSMNVQVDAMPSPNAGSDDIICGLVYSLKGTISSDSHTIWWNDMSLNGSFDDTFSPTATFTGNVANTYILTLNEKDGTCLASDDVNIVLLGSPSANINSEIWNFCSTDGIDDYVPVEISFSGVGDYTYVMKSNGTIYSSVTTSNVTENTQYLVATTDTFTLVSVKDGNGCFAEMTNLTGKKVASDFKPNTFAGDDVTQCSMQYTLQARSTSGATGTWSSTNSNISISDINTPNSMVNSTVYQIASFTWTEDRNGCINSDDVTINFAEPPTLSLSEKDDRICEDNSSSMDIILTGNSPWDVNYTDGSGTFSESNIPSSNHSITVIPNVDTDYSITSVKGNYGCETVYNNMDYNVLVDELPLADAGADSDTCGLRYILKAKASIGEGNWTGVGSFADDTDPETQLTANEFGEEVLTWTVVNGVCSDDDQVTIAFRESPYPVDAGNDTIIYATDNLLLYAKELEVGTGIWTLEDGSADIESPSANNSRLLNIDVGAHRLLWTASVFDGTCPDVTDELVIISNNLFAPTGFSPNGDNLNETFMILGSGNIKNNTLSVFDINGKKVYSANNYQNDWRGTDAGGSGLQAGTYYYVFKGDGVLIKNYLIIKR